MPIPADTFARSPRSLNHHHPNIAQEEQPMIKHASLLIVAAVVGLAPIVPAFAQSKDALSIANNDSVLIDAKSFRMVPGNAEGDAAALIKKLDAKDLGPGAIVFRSGG